MVVYFRSFHGSSQIILCDVTVWHLSEWVSLMSMVSIRTSTGLYISRNFNLYGFLVHGWQAIFTFCWSSPWEFTMLKCLIWIRNHNLPLPGPYKDLRPRAYYFAEKSKYWTFIVKISEKFFGEFVPHKTRQLFSEFNFFSFFEAESMNPHIHVSTCRSKFTQYYACRGRMNMLNMYVQCTMSHID